MPDNDGMEQVARITYTKDGEKVEQPPFADDLRARVVAVMESWGLGHDDEPNRDYAATEITALVAPSLPVKELRTAVRGWLDQLHQHECGGSAEDAEIRADEHRAQRQAHLDTLLPKEEWIDSNGVRRFPYEGAEEHPEGYDGPCMCNLCKSYGD